MFEIIVVSKLFEGIALLERHRLVNEKIAEELKGIHALSMKTWTPKQWESKK
jgi:stress-induced morphogen